MISQSLFEAKQIISSSSLVEDKKLTVLKLLSLVESEMNHCEYSKRDSNARHDVYADVCNKLLKTLGDIARENKYD